MMTELHYAGVEAGGTTFVVGISKGIPTNIVDRIEFPTTTPTETLNACLNWLGERHFDSLGIASFGPVDLDPQSEKYGYITSTPKPGWRNVNIVGAFKERFKCPIAFETDVNAAAISETIHDVQHISSTSSSSSEEWTTGKRTLCYVTVGTGIGVGIIVNGTPVHGLLHPELGHTYVARKKGDEFEGVCSFHKDCLEGLINSEAIARRSNVTRNDLSTLPDDHPVWEILGFYLAQLATILTYTVCPHKIVFGGGLMRRKRLFPIIRRETLALINSYITNSLIPDKITEYIVPSPFEVNAGLIGAIELGYLLKNKKT